jgi:hypothetical protein
MQWKEKEESNNGLTEGLSGIFWRGLSKTINASVTIDGFREKIWKWNLPNMKQKC